MTRREFIAAIGGAVIAGPIGARAQQNSSRRYRIGMLDTVSADLNAGNLNAFRKGMTQLGYTDGTSYLIEYRSADGLPERYPQLAAELVQLQVDLIVTRGTPATLAVKAATTTIPVVVAAAGDPVGTGIVESLARPGGNITGLSGFSTELAGKRVELAKEILPANGRIALLANMSNPVNPLEWAETMRAARVLGLDAELLDVRNGGDIARAFDTAATERIGVIIVALDTVMQANRRLIADLAAGHRLPAIHPAREFVGAGGLMSFRVNFEEYYFRTAGFVDKILKGAKPSDIPIEQPTTLEMVINLKAAKALGLSIPISVLTRADEVIE